MNTIIRIDHRKRTGCAKLVVKNNKRLATGVAKPVSVFHKFRSARRTTRRIADLVVTHCTPPPPPPQRGGALWV